MNKLVITIIVCLVVGFGLGFFIGWQSTNGVLVAQLEKAKKFFPTTADVRSINGTINKIQINIVTIDVSQSGNPFEDLPTTRQVTVVEKTVIVMQQQKDSAVYNQEYKLYLSALKRAATTTLSLPQPYEEKIIKLSDLKVGDTISVEASENIKTSASFTATKIIVQSIPATPTGNPAKAPPVAQ